MERKKKKTRKPKFLLDCCTTDSRLREYNGLIDSNLAAFFSSEIRRKTLMQNKLVSPRGLILTGNWIAPSKSQKIFKNRKSESIKPYISLSPKSSLPKIKRKKIKTMQSAESILQKTNEVTNPELNNRVKVPKLRIKSEPELIFRI